jgi:hypothetical protein
LLISSYHQNLHIFVSNYDHDLNANFSYLKLKCMKYLVLKFPNSAYS